MAEENPTWGYTRIQGAQKNVGHHVEGQRLHGSWGVRDTAWAGASDILADLRASALGGDRRCGLLHDRSLDVAGLGHVLHGRRDRAGIAGVQILGSTPHPDEAFMRQVARTMTVADGKMCRVLFCDRDAKWSEPVRGRLQDGGLRVVQTPYRAPSANTRAERFVRSIKEERLGSLIPFGERHVRRAVAEFVAHYHRERNHQGLGNELIEPPSGRARVGRIRRRSRLGGLLNYCARTA